MTVDPGPAPQRADARRNRDAVLAAAMRVLAERPEASMREVAEASGVGRTTVYRHFPQRDDLVRALFSRVYDEAYEVAARFVERGRAAWAAADAEGAPGGPGSESDETRVPGGPGAAGDETRVPGGPGAAGDETRVPGGPGAAGDVEREPDAPSPTDDLAPEDPADGLEVIVALTVAFVALGERYRFLAVHRELGAEQLDALAAERGDEPLASYLAEAQARGQLRDDLTVRWTLDVINGLTMTAGEHARAGSATLQELRPMLAATVRGALGPRGG